MNRRSISALVLIGAVLLLSSCHLDTTVTVRMHDDGSGVVRVTAVADPELAREVPNLADELRLGDARAAGWRIEGPTETEAGGLRIALAHDFRDADEATALLSSLGGPFADLRVTRTIEGAGDDATALNTVSGRSVLQRGFNGFADQALLDSVGGTPFAGRLTNTTPADSMSIALRLDLPGAIEQTNGTEKDRFVTWDVPVDGSRQTIGLRSLQSPSSAAPGWAGPVATGALIALAAWALVSIWLVIIVIRARRRRLAR